MHTSAANSQSNSPYDLPSIRETSLVPVARLERVSAHNTSDGNIYSEHIQQIPFRESDNKKNNYWFLHMLDEMNEMRGTYIKLSPMQFLNRMIEVEHPSISWSEIDGSYHTSNIDHLLNSWIWYLCNGYDNKKNKKLKISAELGKDGIYKDGSLGWFLTFLNEVVSGKPRRGIREFMQWQLDIGHPSLSYIDRESKVFQVHDEKHVRKSWTWYKAHGKYIIEQKDFPRVLRTVHIYSAPKNYKELYPNDVLKQFRPLPDE